MSDSLPPGDGLDGFDPEERALCPDPACIGVLDGDGRCKVCGQQGNAAAGALPAQISPELPGLPDAVEEPAYVEALAPAAITSATDADSDDFADRRLCADPSCIGVLDEAGRCKECGRVADAAPASS